MWLTKIFAVGFLVAGTAFPQSLENGLRSTLATVRYPPLAEQARIQGNVHIKLNSREVALVSGHPLLAKTAVELAKAMAIPGQTDLDVTYHFVIVETTASVLTPRTVKRGNLLGRAVLRMFGAKTEIVSLELQCQEGPAPANDVMLAGNVIELWIYGRSRCLQVEVGTAVAKR